MTLILPFNMPPLCLWLVVLLPIQLLFPLWQHMAPVWAARSLLYCAVGKLLMSLKA